MGGGHDPRADHQPFVDRLLVADVGIIVGADVADGGEAGLEHVAGMADALRRPEQVGELETGIAAVERVGIEMDVHVDEAGQERLAGQVDPGRALGDDGPGAAAADHRDDPPVGDDDDRLLDHPPGEHVDHPVGGDDDALGRGRRRVRRATARQRMMSAHI